jgi:glutathione S-transferase
MTLALYGHPFSSYTWKALIPLYANGTPFEFREIPEHAEFVRRVHPGGKFPVLCDGDKIVVEATSIVEYLALYHPGGAPLIPEQPSEAVRARMIDRVFDN